MTTDRELLELAAKAAGMVKYDQLSGSMTWLTKAESVKDSTRWNARYAGEECGTIDDKGYRRILFRFEHGKPFRIRAHRLAWFISHGHMPSGEIDHINQDKLDNRISNLRDVTRVVNQRNGTWKSNNTSGVSGVCWHKQRNKWCAQAAGGGEKKSRYIGLFDTIQEAEAAVNSFRLGNGYTNNHGRAITRAAAAIGEVKK